MNLNSDKINAIVEVLKTLSRKAAIEVYNASSHLAETTNDLFYDDLCWAIDGEILNPVSLDDIKPLEWFALSQSGAFVPVDDLEPSGD